MLHPLSNIHHNSLIFNLPSNYLKGIWQIRNMNERETITKKRNCMKSLNIDNHQKITWTRPTNGWILVPIIIVTQTLLWAFTWVKLKIFHPPSEEETSLELSIKQVLQGSSTNSPFDCFELPSSLPAVIFGFLVTSQKKERAYNQFTWMTATATPNPKIISRFPLSKSSVLS